MNNFPKIFISIIILLLFSINLLSAMPEFAYNGSEPLSVREIKEDSEIVTSVLNIPSLNKYLKEDDKGVFILVDNFPTIYKGSHINSLKTVLSTLEKQYRETGTEEAKSEFGRLKKITDCMKKNGLSMVPLGDVNDSWFEVSDKNMNELKKKFGVKKIEALAKLKVLYFSEDELSEALQNCGFNSKDIDEIMFFSLEKKRFSGETEALLKDTLIKDSDSPNFRIVEHKVCGTGQPSCKGLAKTLSDMKKLNKNVEWISFRQEPVIYINDKPCNLRQVYRKYHNLRLPGISADELENIEKKLKEYIIKKGEILLYESEKGKIVEKKIKVSEKDIMTTREAMEKVALLSGFVLKKGDKKPFFQFLRIPVTDESSPGAEAIDYFEDKLRHVSEDSMFVFNCHAGQGRTTTGMVEKGIALFVKRHADKSMKSPTVSGTYLFSRIIDLENYNMSELAFLIKKLKEKEITLKVEGTDDKLNMEIEELKKNIFNERQKVIRPLFHAIVKKDKDCNSKKALDNILDRYALIQNLRKDALRKLITFQNNPGTVSKDTALEGVKRYFILLAYYEYKNEEISGNKDKLRREKFSIWLEKTYPKTKGFFDF